MINFSQKLSPTINLTERGSKKVQQTQRETVKCDLKRELIIQVGFTYISATV